MKTRKICTSDIGGVRTKDLNQVRATRSMMILTYDKAFTGVLLPIPRDEDEAVFLAESLPGPGWPDNYDSESFKRAMKTSTQEALLDGEVLLVVSRPSRIDAKPAAAVVLYPQNEEHRERQQEIIKNLGERKDGD